MSSTSKFVLEERVASCSRSFLRTHTLYLQGLRWTVIRHQKRPKLHCHQSRYHIILWKTTSSWQQSIRLGVTILKRRKDIRNWEIWTCCRVLSQYMWRWTSEGSLLLRFSLVLEMTTQGRSVGNAALSICRSSIHAECPIVRGSLQVSLFCLRSPKFYSESAITPKS